MDEVVVEQKIERPIDGNRGWALAGRLRHPVDHFISAQRAALAGQNFKNAAPAGGEADLVAPAQR